MEIEKFSNINSENKFTVIKYEIWNNKWVLLLIVLLLSMEWFIKKTERNDLINLRRFKMSFIEWNEISIVNHTAMDKEHKKMVDDTNKLYTLINSNKTERANKIIQQNC